MPEVDDKYRGFKKAKSGWRKQAKGYKSRSFWTTVRKARSYRWAQWKAGLTAPGRYEVWVRFPRRKATTRNAVYKVFTADGTRTRKVNQYRKRGKWVKLGTFRFNAVARVKLTDRTGERTRTRRTLVFDVVKFVPVSATSSIAEAVEVLSRRSRGRNPPRPRSPAPRRFPS